MSSAVISVENLGKRYSLGPGGRSNEGYTALRDVIANKARSLFRKSPSSNTPHQSPLTSHARPASQDFWALKDVSFDIQQGEVVGIIGRNGAGKSTLLKILSRITDPTEGRIKIKGRVASLLEVGTGFHPELTGRENIYLNGAILGMSRAEIRAKFDEIVAFAEVEKFLDTPVKRYSSGMYVRLAFAVAAHLEPEILIVDEVLAVGDAEFQKKCLGKMQDVAGHGRTVIFVSHQMNAVQSLCKRCIVLKNGSLTASGEPTTTIARYLQNEAYATSWKSTSESNQKFQNPFFLPSRFEVVDHEGHTAVRDFSGNEEITILIEGSVERIDSATSIGFSVFDGSGTLLFWSLQTDLKLESWPVLSIGHNQLVAKIPSHFLNEGSYRLELMVSLHFQAWYCQPGINAPAITFDIRGELSDSPHWIAPRPGILAPIIPFQIKTNQGISKHPLPLKS